MKTLIVPCADGKHINGIPKYLLRHPDGKLLLEKAIEGIHPENFDQICVAILEDENIKFDAENAIRNTMQERYKIEIILIPKQTGGPAETVYEAVLRGDIGGQIVVKDMNNRIQVPNIQDSNFIAGLELTHWKEDIHNLRRSSFIVLNEQKQVLDIMEKQFRSDYICVGLYGFKKASDYVFAYERLSGSGYPIKTLYVSHIISYLIGYKSHIFHYVQTDVFEDWKDELCYAELQRKHATYFLDLDRIFSGQEEMQVVEGLEILSRKGAEFICFTSQDETSALRWKKELNERGVNCISAVHGCMGSDVKKILRTSAQVNECLYSF